jgi:hypothetical protein
MMLANNESANAGTNNRVALAIAQPVDIARMPVRDNKK